MCCLPCAGVVVLVTFIWPFAVGTWAPPYCCPCSLFTAATMLPTYHTWIDSLALPFSLASKRRCQQGNYSSTSYVGHASRITVVITLGAHSSVSALTEKQFPTRTHTS